MVHNKANACLHWIDQWQKTLTYKKRTNWQSVVMLTFKCNFPPVFVSSSFISSPFSTNSHPQPIQSTDPLLSSRSFSCESPRHFSGNQCFTEKTWNQNTEITNLGGQPPLIQDSSFSVAVSTVLASGPDCIVCTPPHSTVLLRLNFNLRARCTWIESLHHLKITLYWSPRENSIVTAVYRLVSPRSKWNHLENHECW